MTILRIIALAGAAALSACTTDPAYNTTAGGFGERLLLRYRPPQ